MMNNKYLAIGLVIFAVAVVFYQVVLRKDKPKGRNAPASAVSQPATQPSPTPQTATPQTMQPSTNMPGPGSQNTAVAKNDDGLSIDFDSPLLLKRVFENPMDPYPKQELDPPFGTAILSSVALTSFNPARFGV